MSLNYLDFDYSEDADGTGTFDAMASVLPAQLPALYGEIVEVLAWAHAQWPDACAPLEEGGLWQYDLQGSQEVITPLALVFSTADGQLHTSAGAAPPARTTITLTLSGSADFCHALRSAFDME